MGTVVGVLTLLAVTAGSTVTTRLRRATPVISRLSSVLLLVAGAYVAWYGWFELRVLAGTAVEDPVVSTAIGVQGTLSRSVAGLGVVGIGGVALAAVAVTGAWSCARRVDAATSTATSHRTCCPDQIAAEFQVRVVGFRSERRFCTSFRK